ncbi:hypothetical protein N8923_02225 [Candidatus Pelagibacter ubique]|nr:hypothetical protein [Candidatus Pelagibacter ubique]
MKKLFLSILVICSLLSGSAYAEKPSTKITILEKNENLILIKIEDLSYYVPNENNLNKYHDNAQKKVIDTAVNHCSEINKKTLSLSYPYDEAILNGNRAKFIKTGKILQTYGDVIRLKRTTIKKKKFQIFVWDEIERFICSKNPEEVFLNEEQFKSDKFKIANILTEHGFENFKFSDANSLIIVEYGHDKLNVKNYKFLNKKTSQYVKKYNFDTKDQQYKNTCNVKLGLKIGTKKFNDCVYTITTMELELAKINAEKEIALAQAEAAKAKQEFAELERLNTIADANSNKFTKNMANLLLSLFVLGEINQASQQATNFRRTFTCTPTGFASGLQYSVNCY